MTAPSAIPTLLCVMALACVITSGQVLQKFDPEHQQPAKLVSPELTAEAVAKPEDPTTGVSHSIEINAQGRKLTVPLPFQFSQVNAIIQGPAGKLVVVGRGNAYGYEIGIIDTAASRLVDRFACYDPAVSADGQYIAYTKFFAPHGVPAPEDHAMLYVVARSLLENRPLDLRKDIIASDDEDVGFAVYPPGIGNREGDNVNVPPESAHIVAGYYFWKDAGQYFFADRTPKEFRMVWVAIAHGAAVVRSLVIPPSQSGFVQKEFPPRLEDAKFEGESAKLTIRTNVIRSVVVSLAGFTKVGSVDLAARPAGLAPK